jgi:hypothetical protein
VADLASSPTRYADDLFFSSVAPNILAKVEEATKAVVAGLTIPAGLTINDAKTRHSSKRGVKRVTGIILGGDGKPHVARKLKRHIRGMIHKYDALDAPKRESLAGLIAYVIGFEPAFLNSLIQKYGFAIVHRVLLPRRLSLLAGTETVQSEFFSSSLSFFCVAGRHFLLRLNARCRF